SGEAVAHMAATVELDRDRPVIAFDQRPPVTDGELEVWELERTFLAGENQRIKFAKTELAFDVGAEQPRLLQPDRSDGRKAEPVAESNFRAFDRQVRLLGIADDDVGQDFASTADLLDLVRRFDATVFELVGDDAGGYALSAEPCCCQPDQDKR